MFTAERYNPVNHSWTPVYNNCPRYIHHMDPGHGWLEVEKKELRKLKIANKISSYSYMKGAKAFLEEDCDMGIFIDAKVKAGEDVVVQSIYEEDTPIRMYDNYTCKRS